MNIENIPAALKASGRFCGWKYEERPGGGKPAKVPYSPKTGMKLQVNDLNQYGTYADVEGYAAMGYDGIGISISDGICAIDIDHCLNADGTWSDIAVDICRMMQAYTEVSPSGQGLRLLFLAPGCRYDTSKYYINNHGLGLEIYVAGATSKYVSVTGDALFPGAGLEERGPQLQAVLDKYMVRQVQGPSPVPTLPQGAPPIMDDDAVIRAARHGQYGEIFEALMAGDTSAYDGDHSRADQALCSQLAFYTGKNAEQMDRIVRASGLMRDKWDECRGDSTYGQLTIQQAIATQQTVYQPLPAAAPPQSMADLGVVSPQAVVQPVNGQAVAPPPVPRVVTVNAAAASNIPYAAMSGSGIISALELQQLDLPPTVYLIDGILPAGTTLLVAAPKAGKSWMVMDIGLCIASGQPFWGHPTAQCGVLYLALEDSRGRLQNRLNKVLRGQPAPANFYFVNEASTLDCEVGEPLLIQLENYLADHAGIKLIIIDTLQKIRGAARRGESSYAHDYRELGLLKEFADKHGLSLLVVHHTRKMADSADVFNQTSGTNGIMGAVDTGWVLVRKTRSSQEATLDITGRDVEQAELMIRFDAAAYRWNLLGSQADVDAEKERENYDSSTLVQTIKSLLDGNPTHCWSGPAKELHEAMDSLSALSWTAQKIGIELPRLQPLLLKYDNIAYGTRSNGTAGKVHEFYYQMPTV